MPRTQTKRQQDISTDPEPQRLLVAGGAPAIQKAAQALFANTAPLVELNHCEGIDAALAQEGQSHVLVPVSLPLAHLQSAMQAGEAPEAVLDAWCDNCEALLRSCRKARRRVVLIDAEMLAARPAAMAEALGARLGLQFGSVAKATTAPEPELSPIHSAIAASLLAMDVRALELADELEAMMSGPVSPRTSSQDVLSAAARNAASLIEERDLLRENLQQMLTETERLIADKSDEAEKHLLKAQLDAVNRQLEDAKDAHANRGSVLGAAILRLARTARSERDTLAAELKTERDRLTAELDAAREEIARMYASSSWKITKPMRAVRRGLTR